MLVRFVNCWHHEDVPHSDGCAYDLIKIEVIFYLPEVLSGPRNLAPTYQPKYVKHTYKFAGEKEEG